MFPCRHEIVDAAPQRDRYPRSSGTRPSSTTSPPSPVSRPGRSGRARRALPPLCPGSPWRHRARPGRAAPTRAPIAP